jgi:lysophospholipase L1-like esterase
MNRETPAPSAAAAGRSPHDHPAPFGANELRLNFRQWLIALGIVALGILLVPHAWEKIERFDTGPNYRLPYDLSRDYWLYARRLRREIDPAHIIVLGDSVVWGEYVRPDGAWPVFLNREVDSHPRFVNGGVNGMFPLALEGLVRHYAILPKGQKVLLQCNPLWMTSPQADLSTEKEQHFNHSRLVPQFMRRLVCYRADASERLGATLQNHVDFLAWVNHLQDAYFGQKSIPSWTLADDGGDPPKYPNAYRNPFSQITLTVPDAPANDPQRGPESPRHKSWSTNTVGTTRFDWVEPNASIQWAAFQRLVETLQQRGNDLFVVVGPFNEHMMAEDNRPAYHKIREEIARWLGDRHVPHLAPEPLPSLLYADASHPLTAGYELLAKRVFGDDAFKAWVVSR